MYGGTNLRCQAHFIRNLTDACPKSEVADFLASAKQVLYAPNLASARACLKETCQTFEKRCSKAVALLEESFDDVTSVLALPLKYHRLLRTTNSVERINEEIRRRDRVIRIYPNRASCERLLGALLMEFDERMSSGKVYLDMSDYHSWRETEGLNLRESQAKEGNQEAKEGNQEAKEGNQEAKVWRDRSGNCIARYDSLGSAVVAFEEGDLVVLATA
jgi:Transposase, Mutator family